MMLLMKMVNATANENDAANYRVTTKGQQQLNHLNIRQK